MEALNPSCPDLPGQSTLDIKIKVCPGAPRTAWRPMLADGTYKVAVAAAPEKGKANGELLRFLAASWHLPLSCLSLISGAASRTKIIRIKQ
jgi:uncharacterized protein YggU (UPF0235/DUF167 family)